MLMKWLNNALVEKLDFRRAKMFPCSSLLMKLFSITVNYVHYSLHYTNAVYVSELEKRHLNDCRRHNTHLRYYKYSWLTITFYWWSKQNQCKQVVSYFTIFVDDTQINEVSYCTRVAQSYRHCVIIVDVKYDHVMPYLTQF